MSPFTDTYYAPRYPGELLLAFSRGLLDGTMRMEEAGRAAGADVVRAGPGGPRGIVLLRHPDLVRALLIDENDGVVKSRVLQAAQSILGDGLLTLQGDAHARHRRLVLPGFQHGRVRAYGEVMVRRTVEEADRWREGEPFDLVGSMSRLTLGIAAETFFGGEVDVDRVERAVREGTFAVDRMARPLGQLLSTVPTPNARRAKAARTVLDDEVYRMIGEHRATPGSGDLLDLLLAARDEDTGESLSDEEIRDEVVTLLIAGHETTALALTWLFPFLSGHPEVEARLHDEIDALGGRPSFDDLKRLPYTRQVLAESMRLRPPAWSFGREAVRDLDLAGVPISAGTSVLVAPLFLHRDARFWEDPERFDPGRFEGERKSGRHKFAYLPFSAGRRGCIGEQFAWAEGVLVLATLAQRWRLQTLPPAPEAVGSVTYRPAGPVHVRPLGRGTRRRRPTRPLSERSPAR